MTIANHENDGTAHKKTQNKIKYDFKLQVLNGIGKPHLARDVRNYLIKEGLNVISFNNAKRFCYLKSVIIVKKMDYLKLENLTSKIKIKNVYKQINRNSEYDFIIIIGKDYKQYFKIG